MRNASRRSREDRTSVVICKAENAHGLFCAEGPLPTGLAFEGPLPTQVGIVIWGAGGHAKVVADIARLNGYSCILAFIDDVNPGRIGESFCGSVIRGASSLAEFPQACDTSAIVAIGNCEARLQRTRQLAEHGFRVATLVHPKAVVADDAHLGEGALVAAGAVVNPGATVGSAAIINTGAVVDHDCVIGDGAHLCPGAKLAGQVRIGRAAWVGIGATVIENISIGDGAVIGAGAVVLRNIPPRTVAYGVPARKVREVSI
jgi:UDP-N-acetylbacillosamine N-acetyltransferase